MSKKRASILFELVIIVLFAFSQTLYGQMKTEDFTFEYEGKKYDGIIDLPIDQNPTALIVIIHGHGKTNVVEDNW